jgi:hypothetical protein
VVAAAFAIGPAAPAARPVVDAILRDAPEAAVRNNDAVHIGVGRS